MRRTTFLGLLSLASLSVAQDPNVTFRVHLTENYFSNQRAPSRLRLYDSQGKMSVVGFGVNLETGYFVLVTERLQKIPRNRDTSHMEDLYIEDPGLWRVGRQSVPFGQGLVQERANGVSVSSRPLGGRFPVVLMAFDNGPREARGLVARSGNNVGGASLAYGERMFRASTNFCATRHLEEPIAGPGYRIALSMDGVFHLPVGHIEAEAGVFRGRKGTPPLDLTDIRYVLERGGLEVFAIGWARDWRKTRDQFRLGNEFGLTRNLSLQAQLRFSGGDWDELVVGTRLRL